MNDHKSHGTLVISLDFELLYGMNDTSKLNRWTRNAAGAREAIPQILTLFEENGIHATWGIVGMLYAKDRAMWQSYQPERIPMYREERFSNYIQSHVGENEGEDPLHFAPTLIEKIGKTPGQEIGSHTFSHYYCMEQGQNAEDFRADVQAALHIHETCFQSTMQSFIFPKNQFQEEYLAILDEHGIKAVRGNETGYLYRATEAGESLLKRGLRLLDSYVNLSGYHCYKEENLQKTGGVLDIPSSRFLRPYSQKLKLLEGWKLRRIKGQMHHAAKKGEICHIWWHPHNFGSNTPENIENLEKLLHYYRKLKEKYGMESRSMGEIADRKGSSTIERES